MARQPASNEEALVKLGSEKLARLVIGEAKRNAAFRKLVAAALAATKGPAAVAAIIDKRLAGLDRAKAFVDWEKAKTATEEELRVLKGVGDVGAAAIIKNRPYKGKDELVQKKIIPLAVYAAIKDKIIAKQP